MAFMLAGQQWNKPWPYVAYLTCAVCQNVRPPSFLSTSVRYLIPLTDVLFQQYCQLYGIPELLIANVKQFHIGSSTVVSTAHRNTEKVSTTSGVLQVDTLAHFLFITLLEYVLREMLLNNIDSFTITPRKCSRYPAVRIGALLYADDIVIALTHLTRSKMYFIVSKGMHQWLVSRSTSMRQRSSTSHNIEQLYYQNL